MSADSIESHRTASGRPVQRRTVPIRRWLTLGLVWAAFFISFVDRLTWSNVSVSVGSSLGLEVAALNVFVTAFYTGYVLSNVISGIATDWFGGRMMLTLALLPLGAATATFGFTTSVAFGLATQALMGFAAGADNAAGVKLITGWFGKKDRGRAMGLYFTAPTFGVIITNALVPVCIQWLAWSTIYQLFGFVTIAIGIACFVFLRDVPPAPNGEPERVHEKPKLTSLFRNRDLIFLTLAGFGAMWGSWGFTFWVNALMIRGHGMSPIVAGGIVALFGVGAIFGNPLMGLLSDLLGGVRKVPIMLCLSCFTVLLLVFGGLHTEQQFRLFAPVLGVAAFVYMPLLSTMVAEVAGLALAGSATGITNACWQLGTILVPVVVGIVFQSTDSFYSAFVTLAAGPVFAIACMTLVREPRPSRAQNFPRE
ncbi:MFS transporter [Rhodovulum sp. PH10]|uniref:MFS transporter n=1 Tax=Rhodovulum sp. PH10 TaxID=1187851 RepID=UPI000A01B2F5|nr:MFS transporter [Rhodovulum sp. PH10]